MRPGAGLAELPEEDPRCGSDQEREAEETGAAADGDLRRTRDDEPRRRGSTVRGLDRSARSQEEQVVAAGSRRRTERNARERVRRGRERLLEEAGADKRAADRPAAVRNETERVGERRVGDRPGRDEGLPWDCRRHV